MEFESESLRFKPQTSHSFILKVIIHLKGQDKRKKINKGIVKN